ncbi:MAG: head GIN domain-containing protein [Dehalococcoidia bacterium]
MEKEYSFQEFDRVEVSSAVEFEMTQSADHSIKVTGYENLIERLEVEVSGQTLVIRLKPGSYFRNNVKAVIAMPELNKLVVSGASRGTAKGFTSADDFALEVSGASRVEMDIGVGNIAVDISGASTVTGELKAQDTRLMVSGASRCELSGTGGDTDLNVSGASRVNLLQFQIQNADVNISGASRASINMTGTLNVDLSGASSLEYTGDAVLGRVNITGASRLSSK